MIVNLLASDNVDHSIVSTDELFQEEPLINGGELSIGKGRRFAKKSKILGGKSLGTDGGAPSSIVAEFGMRQSGHQVMIAVAFSFGDDDGDVVFDVVADNDIGLLNLTGQIFEHLNDGSPV